MYMYILWEGCVNKPFSLFKFRDYETKQLFVLTHTSRLVGFAAWLFLNHEFKMTGYRCVFKIFRRSVDGKHLMRFSSEAFVLETIWPAPAGSIFILISLGSTCCVSLLMQNLDKDLPNEVVKYPPETATKTRSPDALPSKWALVR